MSLPERPDDFESRRQHLRELSDEELHARFWSLVGHIVDPLIDEARSHTTPSIERSVLLRMGLSSIEARGLVDGMSKRGLLGCGAGHLLLELAERRIDTDVAPLTVRDDPGALLVATDRLAEGHGALDRGGIPRQAPDSRVCRPLVDGAVPLGP